MTLQNFHCLRYSMQIILQARSVSQSATHFFEDTRSLFQFQSVCSFLFLHLGASPALSWVGSHSVLTWHFIQKIDKVKVWLSLSTLFLRHPCQDFEHVVCSFQLLLHVLENGSDPCSPLESCCSVVPRVNHILHELCDFPCVRT